LDAVAEVDEGSGGSLRSSVADYQVIRALPATAAGEARYLCEPPGRLERAARVMITELDVDAAGWRDLAGRLARLVGVRSPHLLELLEVGPDLDPEGAGVYLASESAPGGSLAHPTAALDVADQVRALAQAARGAHALHQAGIAHGSIAAESILLTERGAVLAPPVLGGPAGTLARMRDWRDVVGLDPALLRGEPPTRASDIWALAATLHGLVSSRPLYPEIDSDPGVTALQRILFTRPEIDPTLPGELTETLAVSLADDPGERLLAADEFADRLAGVEVAP
jgi:serine/threonine protein kinase